MAMFAVDAWKLRLRIWLNGVEMRKEVLERADIFSRRRGLDEGQVSHVSA